MNNDLMVIAGEASADFYAAQILRHLHDMSPSVKAFGVGGRHLQEAGMEQLVPASALSVMGFSDWLGRAREVIGAYRKVVRTLEERLPSAVLMLDLPDLNLRLAKHCHRLDIPVIYFISPQVWAWRAWRIEQIRSRVTKMLVIFPFEEKLYLDRGIDAEFVGHPMLELAQLRPGYRDQADILVAPRIAVLPGSRPSELELHLPVLQNVCESLQTAYPGAQFRLPVASTVVNHPALKKYTHCELIEGDPQEVLRWADVAMVASGTATLEAALVGTPMVAFYKVARGTEIIFRMITRYRDFIALPNVIMKTEIIPEFIQNRFKADLVFPALKELIGREDVRMSQLLKLSELRLHLESKQVGMQPSRVVATRVNAVLRENHVVEGRRLLVEPSFT